MVLKLAIDRNSYLITNFDLVTTVPTVQVMRREQSDDEVRTSQVPERRECKTKVIKQQYLPLAVCAEGCETAKEQRDDEVRTSQVPERRECKTKVMKQ